MSPLQKRSYLQEQSTGVKVSTAGQRLADMMRSLEILTLRSRQERVGLEPNLEIANNVNTLLKMSQKRAFECGIFYAAGISEFFSQDLEDMLMAALCSHDSTNF